jgi:hypothetical protein
VEVVSYLWMLPIGLALGCILMTVGILVISRKQKEKERE